MGGRLSGRNPDSLNSTGCFIGEFEADSKQLGPGFPFTSLSEGRGFKGFRGQRRSQGKKGISSSLRKVIRLGRILPPGQGGREVF